MASTPEKTKDDRGTKTRTAQTPTKKRDSLAHRLYTGQISYDFIGRRKRWYAISGALLLISILALAILQLQLGIEFKGGADFQAPTQVNAQTVDKMREAVSRSGVPNVDEATVTTLGGNTVRVQTRSLDANTEVPKVRGAIAQEVNTSPERVAYSLIGASWGKQITSKAGMALAVFLVLVMLLIWVYFRDFKMSMAAIVALIHDLILTVGIYALVGFTFTPASLIGLLTILGYSLYDTVVVFDKVRENVKGITSSNKTYAQAANAAVNQVLVRSLNTTIIGVLPVAAILFAGAVFLGTGPLKDLGLALFVGMVAGAYSSIFIATPLLVEMKNREPAMRKHHQTLERRAARRRSGHDADETGAVEASAQAAGDGGADDGHDGDVDHEEGAIRESPAARGDRHQPHKKSRSERRK